MGFFDEICSFLEENGLSPATEKIHGHDIIYIGDSSFVIPIEIHAQDLIQAEEEAESLRETIGHVLEKYGNYPLVITEDRWRFRPQMMRMRLLAHLNIFTQIYARNCEVRKIDRQTAADFLSANHSYGDAACRYRYGLFLKRHTGHNSGSAEIIPETLVAVATFSNARKWIKGDKVIRSYEWTRYASLPEVRLSGGMGKLLKAFIKEVKPDDIMTYADLEWSEGKVYEALGFKPDGYKEPIYFMVNTSWKRHSRFAQATSSIAPVKPEMTADLYYRNLGSNKYRLKLTDYQ